MSERLFKNVDACQDMVVEALKYHLLPDRRRMMSSRRTQPRKSYIGQLFAFGADDTGKLVISRRRRQMVIFAAEAFTVNIHRVIDLFIMYGNRHTVKKIIPSETIPACDGQTDRQTDRRTAITCEV